MKKELNSNLLFTAKCALSLLLIMCVAIGCSNKREEKALMRDFSQRKRAEIFISKLDMPQRLEQLLLETRGDTALLARVLLAPEASVKRLMAGEAQPTKPALKKKEQDAR